MKISKKIVATVGAVLVSGAIVGVMQNNKGDATTEPPIVTEVRHQGEVLANHEDRLTNVEADVKTVQASTGTPESTNKVSVREVKVQSTNEPLYAEPAPQVQPEPPPPKVVVKEIQTINVSGTENVECKITFSDGTVKKWLWKTVEYNQGAKITRYDGECRVGLVGMEKGTF